MLSASCNVVVVGLARSGIAAASFLARRGAGVVAVDRKREDELPREALALREKGVRLELGAQDHFGLASAVEEVDGHDRVPGFAPDGIVLPEPGELEALGRVRTAALAKGG